MEEKLKGEEGEKVEGINSKAGVFSVSVSGTQEEPKIDIEEFTTPMGMKVGGSAIIQQWKGYQPGLFLRVGGEKVYIQCAEGIERIRGKIEKLPHKVYMARKVPITIDSDGYKIETMRWEVEGLCETEKGTLISESRLTNFLDWKDIMEITVKEAMKLWAQEKEEEYIKVNEEGNKRDKAMFDADVAEVGYHQACDNAGIPKFLR